MQHRFHLTGIGALQAEIREQHDHAIPRLNEDPRSRWLTPGARWIRVWLMIRPGFLSAAERGALIAVARDGLVEHRVAPRAGVVCFLHSGRHLEPVGAALLLSHAT